MVNTIEDYIPYLKEEFPDLPEAVLEKIIKTGVGNMQDLINRDHDVRIWNAHQGREYHLGLVRGVKDDDRRKQRAFVNRHRLIKLRAKRKEQNK